jgi:hypothetical protein
LLDMAEGKVTVTRLPDVVEGGRALPALDVRGASLEPVTLVFDPTTHLVFAQRYQGLFGPAGAATEEEYADYRNVDGLQVAFSTVVRRSGTPIVRRRLRTVEYNVPLDTGLFTKPS